MVINIHFVSSREFALELYGNTMNHNNNNNRSMHTVQKTVLTDGDLEQVIGGMYGDDGCTSESDRDSFPCPYPLPYPWDPKPSDRYGIL